MADWYCFYTVHIEAIVLFLVLVLQDSRPDPTYKSHTYQLIGAHHSHQSSGQLQPPGVHVAPY